MVLKRLTSACKPFAGTCGFNGGIQRQQIGL
jgi:hypothetical protein